MMNNKRGAAELSMTTVILAIIAIIVLLLIVTFFTGGLSTVFGKIRDVFKGGTAGYDVDLAKAQCQSYCERAKLLSNDQWGSSTYCTQGFDIDSNKDGSVGSGEGDIKCRDSKLLGSGGCSPVTC